MPKKVWERSVPPFRFITVPAAKQQSVGQVLDRHRNRCLGGSIMGIQKPCTSQTDQGILPIACARDTRVSSESSVHHMLRTFSKKNQKGIFALVTC